MTYKYSNLNFCSLIFPILLTLLSTSCKNISQELSSPKAKIFDQYITRMNVIGEFNGNILVAENGSVIYRKSIGLNSTDPEDSLTMNSQFRLASTSKPLTALAIIKLEEAGKLEYDDLLTKFIPEWPYEGITVRNLLNHTSGIPNHQYLFLKYWKPEYSPNDRKKMVEGNEQMIQLYIKHKPPVEFPSGERYSYSDAGYILLATVIEKVSGRSFPQFMRESIFIPAGMENTHVFSPLQNDPLKYRAFGIMPALNKKGHMDIDFSYLHPLLGANGIYSTVEDLYSLDRILYTEELVSSTSIMEAFSPTILNNGDTIQYGFGWSIRKSSSGGKVVAHSGYSAGFGIELIRELDKENTIIILSNYGLYLWDGIIQNLYRILENKDYEVTETRSIAEVFGPTLLNNGLDSARSQYFQMKTDSADKFSFDVNALNELACTMLRYGHSSAALDVSRFNNEIFPGAASVWHSLGSCYLLMGNNKNAIVYFNKALETDNNFAPSKDMLIWLESINWTD